MCGIVGFVDKSIEQGPAKSAVRAMAEAIRHRGPDGRGYFGDPASGLQMGHLRLAIQDISEAGAQPMNTTSGRYVLCYNGEIYNFQDLRRSIEAQCGPVNWRGHSDTEVLLKVIEEFGFQRALELAVGMFALALWDATEQVLYLARDRFGEKPLYYHQDGSALAFSSELKALSQFPGFKPELNEGAIGTFLQLGYVPGTKTLLANVNKVRPAHYLRISFPAAAISEHCYWSRKALLYDNPRGYRSVDEAADQLEDVLAGAVEDQLIADVSVGAFLSAGIDSSLVCSIVRKRLGKPLLTFSMGFDDPRYDESAGANAIAAHLGTDHHEHRVSTTDILDIVERVPELFDEPLGDTSVIPTYMVCRMARQHVTVALSGDGGDEVFGGYNHYRWGPGLARGIARLPHMASRWFGQTSSSLGYLLNHRGLAKLGRLVEAAANGDARTLLNGSLLDAQNGSRTRIDAPDMPLSELDGLSPTHQLMGLDLLGFLPDDILCKVDRAAMSVSLETRAPFLDHNVAEFAWSLPVELTAGGKYGKKVLRTLLERHVPASLVGQQKRGFGIPLDRLFRSELKHWVEKHLNVLMQKYSHLVMPQFVERYWHEHLNGTFNWQREIWTLVTLSMFLETHF